MTRLGFSAVLALLVFSSPQAFAQLTTELDLTLVIDNPVVSVGPNESVEIFATLTNESTSSENLTNDDIAAPFIVNGTLLDLFPNSGNPYNVDFTNLVTFDLSPGSSINLSFITLLPDPAPVAAGTYSSTGIGFDYGVDGNGASQFSVASTNGIEVTVVPEPSGFGLICLSAALFGLRRRRAD